MVKGKKVREGQLIGWADSTGYSSGNHLHFELKPVEWNQNAGQWWNVFQENGFRGGVDPLLYVSRLSAYEVNSFLYRIKYMLADIINRSKLTG